MYIDYLHNHLLMSIMSHVKPSDVNLKLNTPRLVQSPRPKILQISTQLYNSRRYGGPSSMTATVARKGWFRYRFKSCETKQVVEMVPHLEKNDVDITRVYLLKLLATGRASTLVYCFDHFSHGQFVFHRMYSLFHLVNRCKHRHCEIKNKV